MLIIVEEKNCVMIEFVIKKGDIGLLEVQVVILLLCILILIEYFKIYKKDNYLCCGLLKLVVQCCKLLDYLKCKDEVCYIDLIGKLGLCC